MRGLRELKCEIIGLLRDINSKFRNIENISTSELKSVEKLEIITEFEILIKDWIDPKLKSSSDKINSIILSLNEVQFMRKRSEKKHEIMIITELIMSLNELNKRVLIIKDSIDTLRIKVASINFEIWDKDDFVNSKSVIRSIFKEMEILLGYCELI